MKFRRGDIVSVQATVDHDQSESEYLFVTIAGTSRMIRRGDVTMEQPHIEIGEKVMVGPHQQWEVLGIHGDELWVGRQGESQIVSASEVERVDPPDTTEQPPAAPPNGPASEEPTDF